MLLSAHQHDLSAFAICAVLDDATGKLIEAALSDRDPDADLDLRVTRDGTTYRIEATAVRFEAVLGERAFTVVADRLPEHQKLALLAASVASTLSDLAGWRTRMNMKLERLGLPLIA